MDKKIIYEEVLKLEGGVHRKGFEYIVRMIEKFYDDSNLKMMAAYHEIATEYNTTGSRVERAIRYYIEKCLSEGNKEEIAKLKLRFEYPTVKEFVKSFVLYLKLTY